MKKKVDWNVLYWIKLNRNEYNDLLKEMDKDIALTVVASALSLKPAIVDDKMKLAADIMYYRGLEKKKEKSFPSFPKDITKTLTDLFNAYPASSVDTYKKGK